MRRSRVKWYRSGPGLSGRMRLLVWRYATGYPRVPRSLELADVLPLSSAYLLATHRGPSASVPFVARYPY